MKYVLIEIFLFFMMCFFINVNLLEENTQSVFFESNDNLFYQYVFIETPGLTTRNFQKYFEDTNLVVAIYPKVNLLYKDRLGNIKFVCNKKCKLEEFENSYQETLSKYNYITDSVNIEYYGVPIDKLLIYVNSQQLNDILQICSFCKTKIENP